MKYVAHKSFVGRIIEAEKDGSIFMFNEEIPVEKGELVFINLKDEPQLITKKQLENDFVNVEIVDKQKSNLKDQYEKAFLNLNTDEYKKMCLEFGTLDK